MRKSFDNEIMYRKKNRLFGINFGSDAAAEHEWGIDGLRKAFGIPDDASGLEKRKITKTCKNLEWVSTDKFSGFWTKPYCDAKVSGFRFHGEKLYTAWDEKSFVAFSNDPETIKQLKIVYDAILNLDAAIFLGGGAVFKNAGLKICIASEIPKEKADEWKAADEERDALRREFAATGIEAKLRAAGKRYFALKPDRDNSGKLIFWLNPCEQHKYNAMWATLEDLEDWIQDKGRIIMTPEERDRYRD